MAEPSYSARTKGPLRRVLHHEQRRSEDNIPLGIFDEVLECGHRLLQKSDIYGPNNAYRRRCHKCRDAGNFGPIASKE